MIFNLRIIFDHIHYHALLHIICSPPNIKICCHEHVPVISKQSKNILLFYVQLSSYIELPTVLTFLNFVKYSDEQGERPSNGYFGMKSVLSLASIDHPTFCPCNFYHEILPNPQKCLQEAARLDNVLTAYW